MTSSVIFIDWRVEDPQSIVAGLPADSAWYILMPNEDGIGQIRRLLAGYADLASVQIVSHGSDGTVLLGSSAVDAAGLVAEASALSDIGSALSATGDLLLYGCDVGQGETGRAFIDELARLTGADVAASIDRTGAAALGGNWTLEVASGTIETAALTGVAYAGLLPLGPPTTYAVITPTIAFRAEGLTGTALFTFTVTRTGDLTVAQSVDWTVAGAGPNPAVASDFVGNVLPFGTLNFGINQGSAAITVNVVGGFSAEPSEGFTVTLSNPTNGLAIDTATAGATIIDGPGIVYRASIDPVATEANGSSSDPSLAPDGTMVAFASQADNLVTGDFNEVGDIFVKNLTTGLVQRISMGFAGDEATGTSLRPVFSPAGGKIAFVSQADNLVAGDGNFTQDIFVWSNGVITRVSTDSLGGEANAFSDAPAFSSDGTKLVFVSAADNLVAGDTNGTEDIFVKDLLSGQIVRVNTSALGVEAQGDGEGGGYSYDPIFSPDAAQVAFVSIADNLVSGDTNGVTDIFVKTLTGGPLGAIVRVSVNAGNAEANGDSYDPVFSPDGGRVAFTSDASNLIAGDSNNASDIFIKTLSDGSITRISTDAAGAQADGSSWGAVLSPDGARVFFVSAASNLVAGDTNGAADIFVKDLFTGAIARLSTDSFGLQASAGGDSDQFVLSSDGNRLAFQSSATNLVNGDTNGATDIFIRSVSTVVVTPSDAVKPEGQSGTTSFTFTATRSGDTTQSQSVAWQVAGTGANPADSADFGGSMPSGFVAFGVGETSNIVTLSVSGDTDIELDEGFTITLSAPSAGLFIMAPSANGTIQNDDSSTVSITPLSASQAEGNGGTTAFTFTVGVNQPVANFESVDWAVTGSGSHPADAADFGGSLPTGFVTFSFYDSSATVTVFVTGDVAAELDEGFTVTLSNATPGLTLGTATANGTIQNDDGSTVSIAPSSAVKPEGNSGNTSYTFAVTLNQAAVTDQTVDWTVAGSGAHVANAADFGGALPAGTLTFTAGTTTVSLTVAVSGDATVEFDEDFTVTLSNASAGLTIGTAAASGTIQNDDASTVSIAALSASQAEGNAGTTSFTFTVSLDQPGVAPQSVTWAVTGTGAHPANAADFGGSLPTGLVSFAAGEISKIVTVAVAGDTAIEFNEAFAVTLSAPTSGLVLGTSTASGTIQNDDSAVVSIAPSSAVKPEGNGGSTSFTFAVTLDQAAVTNLTVDWAVAGSGAHPANATDFGGSLPSGTVTFTTGTTSASITVAASGDTTVEFNEDFTVTLSNASAGVSIGAATASGTIQNDDSSTVSIAALSASQAEGNAGTTSFTFTVSLDQPGVTPQSVAWAVTGTGAHPADAVDFGGSLPTGLVSFSAGETSKIVTVAASGDTTIELDEAFTIALSGPTSGLVLGTATASGTIQNDDSAVVSIAPLSAVKPEGSSGTTPFTFTVSLDRALLVDQSFQWSVAGSGSHPVEAADFGGLLASGFGTFAAGETSTTVTAFVAGDTAVEFDEGFTVTLSTLSSGLILGTSSASGTIQNDDVSIVSIAPLAATTPEGNSGSTAFTFTVSLDQPGTTAQTVSWSVAGSGAQAASAADFGGSFPTGSVTFAAGETSKIVTVLASADTTVERDEGFAVTLSGASSGLALGTATAGGTIQNDDRSAVSIAALAAARPEGNSGPTSLTFKLTLDQAAVSGQTVDWAVAGSGANAANSADFGGSLPSGSVSFAVGEISKTLTVAVTGDSTVELDEGFTVALSNASAGLVLGTSSASGTIQNDDRSIVAIAPVTTSVIEGDSGTTPFSFKITLDQASVTAQSVEWTVAGSGGHPANAADFGGALPTGAVTFAPGEIAKTGTISVSGDLVLESNEGFTIALVNPSSGLTLGAASTTGTIVNDDGLVVSIADLSAVNAERDDGSTIFSFTIRLNHLLGIDGPTVDWTVSGSGDHPADSADFGGILPSGTATFGPNQLVVVVTVLVSGDTTVELDETFTVTLSNPAAGLAIGTESANGTIGNDDVSVVSIAAASAAKAEGSGGGTTIFTFTVSLDQAGATAQGVDWSVSGIGAHAASAGDFAGGLPSGSVTFAAGETSKIVAVEVAADGAVEFDEGFAISLANASSGLALGASSAAGTILNDDRPVASVAALSASRPEGDNGTTALTFIVSLDQAGLTGQTLDWTVSGSGPHAAGAADFGGSLPSGSLTFAAGETSKVVTVAVSGDTAVELDETFTLALSNASSGLALGTASAGGTILNDDRSVVAIAPLSALEPEGDGGTTTFTFTVSLDQAGVAGQAVAWSVIGTGPHAADAADFGGGLPTGAVTFATGEISKTVTLDATGDGAVEFDEGFAVVLSNATSGLAIGVSTAGGTIVNDDRPTVSIAALSADKAEGNSGSTAFTFRISLDQASVTDQTVEWSIAGSGVHAASAGDFGGSLPSASLTFTAGETDKVVTVLVSADAIVEVDEGFTASLSTPSAGLMLGTSTASGTIRNDDRSTVSIGALAAAKPEGDSGSTLFTFTVALDQAALADQTVAWSVTGTGPHAASPADFGGSLPSGAIAFAAGEASKTVSVAVSGDAAVEFDEAFAVTLSGASSGLVLGTTSAQGTIQNDDRSVVSVAALAAARPEGDTGTTLFTFTLTLGQAGVASQTVAWAVSGAGAHPADAADFGGTPTAGVETFAPGETSRIVTVAVSGDMTTELDEGFSVTLSSPSSGLVLGIASASATIVNDDHAASLLTIAPLAAVRAEGDSGPISFTFVLSLDTTSAQPATVDWVVAGSGAHPAGAADFGGMLPSGTMTFAADETTKVLTVLVSSDTAVEPDEDFTVTLSNASPNLVLAAATATGTILNDDTPRVSVAAQSAAKPEGDSGTTPFSFVVTLDQAATTSQTVDWSAVGSGVHAADAADFGGMLPFGKVTFAAGETAKTVTLLVSSDAVPEFNETFDLVLTHPSAGLALGTATASGTILNDDLAMSIAALSATKGEGNAGTTPFTFLVTLAGDTSGAHSVAYAVSFSGGDPAISSDFAGNAFPAGTLSFAPGEASKIIVVNVAGDVVKEASETFTVTLSDPSAGVVIGSASATGTILNDDTLPSLPPAAHDDAYIDFPGQALHVGAANGVLFNDDSTVPLTASLLTGPAHGTLVLASDGGFDYTPNPGFFGIDSFGYRATGIGSTSDEHALIYVTPLAVGATTTLDLTRLSVEEQVAATYVAFFDRGADAPGFAFWVHEFAGGAGGQNPATLFANVASSFAISDEARSQYPFLANPLAASDSQIGAFLDTVYNNLFDRSTDAAGLAYWTGQIRQAMASGGFVGSVLTDIMSGAQNTADGQDITTLMSKVAVSLSYVHDQQRLHAPWTEADDKVDATALLHAVTADPETVLVGIVQAYNLSLASLARTDGFGGTPGGIA